MDHTKFDVSRFLNKSGATSWRVSDYLHGVRIRKNFSSREEAAAEKGVLEVKAAQANHGLQTVVTSLTPQEVHEAEGIFRHIRSGTESLTFLVSFALSNSKAPDQKKKLADACAIYRLGRRRCEPTSHGCS